MSNTIYSASTHSSFEASTGILGPENTVSDEELMLASQEIESAMQVIHDYGKIDVNLSANDMPVLERLDKTFPFASTKSVNHKK